MPTMSCYLYLIGRDIKELVAKIFYFENMKLKTGQLVGKILISVKNYLVFNLHCVNYYPFNTN